MEATFVTEKNQELFEPALPEGLKDRAGLIIGAIDDEETACGVAAFEETDMPDGSGKVINLLYIYVDPEYREMGAGMRMVSLAIQYARNYSFGAIQAQIPRTPEYLPVFRLLEDAGFTQDEEEDQVLWRVPLKYFEEPFFKKEVEAKEKIFFLEDLDSKRWESVIRMAQEKLGKTGARMFDIRTRAAYSEELSCVAFDKGDPVGGVLVEKAPDGDIVIEMAVLLENNVKLFFKMMKEVCIRLKDREGEDAVLQFIPAYETEELLVNNSVREHGARTYLAYQCFVV